MVTGTGKFPCTGCGQCCKTVWYLMPKLALPDGSCKHLQDDNSCGIYEDRPEICRINFKNHRKRIEEGSAFSEIECKTEKEYFEATANICNLLQESAGMDKSFRVDLGDDDEN